MCVCVVCVCVHTCVHLWYTICTKKINKILKLKYQRITSQLDDNIFIFLYCKNVMHSVVYTHIMFKHNPHCSLYHAVQSLYNTFPSSFAIIAISASTNTSSSVSGFVTIPICVIIDPNCFLFK